MQAIMLSIHPKPCEQIASYIKTIEVRKTKPKIDVPFKCYIYETKGKRKYEFYNTLHENTVGKVIGEFVCDYIYEYQAEFTDLNIYDSLDKNVCQNTISKIIGYNEDDDVKERHYIIGNEEENPDDCELLKNSCLTFNELRQYIGDTFYDKSFYGYHISDLKIYDKPKELSEFKKRRRECWYAELGLAKRDCPECKNSSCFLSRPPQSWCYVEELR